MHFPENARKCAHFHERPLPARVIVSFSNLRRVANYLLNEHTRKVPKVRNVRLKMRKIVNQIHSNKTENKHYFTVYVAILNQIF